MDWPTTVSECCFTSTTPHYVPYVGTHGRDGYQYTHDTCNACNKKTERISVTLAFSRLHNEVKRCHDMISTVMSVVERTKCKCLCQTTTSPATAPPVEQKCVDSHQPVSQDTSTSEDTGLFVRTNLGVAFYPPAVPGATL